MHSLALPHTAGRERRQCLPPLKEPLLLASAYPLAYRLLHPRSTAERGCTPHFKRLRTTQLFLGQSDRCVGLGAFSSASLPRSCPERAVGSTAAAVLQTGFSDGLWTGGGGGAEPDLSGDERCQDHHSRRGRGGRKFGSPMMWEHYRCHAGR